MDTGIDSQQKIIAPRLLYGNQWGYMCPSETPEGGPCGLVKQLSLSAYITTQCDVEPIMDIIGRNLTKDGNTVFHNGAPIGVSGDINKLAAELRFCPSDSNHFFGRLCGIGRERIEHLDRFRARVSACICGEKWECCDHG